jgi:hypothetical protein
VRVRVAGLRIVGIASLGLLMAQQPTKEYIRLGGRVIAIETTAPPAVVVPPAGPLAVSSSDTSEKSFTVTAQSPSTVWTVSLGAGSDAAVTLTNSLTFTGEGNVTYRWTVRG